MATFGVNPDNLSDDVLAGLVHKRMVKLRVDRNKLASEVDSLRARLQRAVAEREAALDCHPADGASFCGACLSCWARVHDEVVRERDAAIGHVTTWEPIVRAAQALQVVYDDRQSMAVQQDCMIDLIDRVRRTLE